ncbi:long-chain fatty acid--CoA ligase [Desulfoscipio geothermicus]|uniref:Fatty-acyl-CoA synthase n=1 Tax=Desulfoscipio geothermicus DSM 3669 TaxID=1121426 RepID=A0A1I6DY93_9FIRM|nr:long-chain fatty acid--CoA ligase [Desulfoscipio geothermicus]SFR10396.1 fatty-acyl-CoA synthase [Desulfoscipio geothermicus DSM 3669]
MNIIKGFPSTSMNDYQLNTTTIIRHAARNFPEREIVYRTSEGVFRYNYAEAYARIQKMANALEKLGMKTGDRIGVLEWNTHRFYELYYAIPGIGAVLLQMNLRITPDELIYVVNHSEAKLVFVDESLIPLAEAIAPGLKTVKGYIIMTNKNLADIKTELNPVYSYENLLDQEEPYYDWPMIDETSAYSACYTTGTTGKPKGVYYSHRCIYLHAMEAICYAGISWKDSFMQIVPMFHAQGWGFFFSATFMGSRIVLPGRYMVEDLKSLVDLMIEEQVSIGCGAPAVFMPMLNYIKTLKEKPSFSGARFISGATEPPLIMMKEWKELTGADIIHAYGSTETAPLSTYNFIKPDLVKKLSEEEKWNLKRKQGLPVTGMDIKIVDSEGNELPRDGKSSGEILIRGPWITGSYYNDPRTRDSFLDGYWRSGDAGVIDPEGYVKITDRVKDLIKSGGEWISSVDLENAIMSHPKVLEATVTGVHHPKWEERPLAFVVLKDEFKDRVTKGEIIDYLAIQFAKWQLPDDVLFLDEIPKTSVGKFNKKVLREKYKNYLINSTKI